MLACWLGLYRIEKQESIEDSKITDEHLPGMLRLNKHATASVG
jgi:hypothetical protein